MCYISACTNTVLDYSLKTESLNAFLYLRLNSSTTSPTQSPAWVPVSPSLAVRALLGQSQGSELMGHLRAFGGSLCCLQQILLWLPQWPSSTEKQRPGEQKAKGLSHRHRFDLLEALATPCFTAW